MNQKNLPIILGIVLLVGVAGALLLTRSKNSDNSSANTAPQASSVPTATPTLESNNQPSMTPTMNTESNNIEIKDFKNKLVTLSVKNYGDISFELYDQDAPKAVENFVRLASKGYYNGVSFHRIIPGFVIQAGDPTGTGAGGESAFGGDFEDELNANTQSYKTGYVKGVLAMANKGPNTNSSQFFVTLGDMNQQLAKSYTIFGKVVKGLDVVDKIGAKGSPSGVPQDEIIIEKATVTSK